MSDIGTFWPNLKVVVTGGGGFLGTRVVRALEARGCLAVTVPRQDNFNLVDPEAIRRLLREVQPDLVIHMAAKVGGIGANSKRPAEFFYDNLMMGVQLLHESWVAKVNKFVGVGTVCSYPSNTPVPFKESEIWNGYPEATNAPYGLAKKMLLVQSQAYRSQYGFESIFLLPANLYGPGDNFDLESGHVIPAIIRKCVEARDRGKTEVVLWGTGEATREFLYVDDAAEGILLAAERYGKPEPMNIGTGSEISIKALAEKIVEITGFEGRLVWDSRMPDGQMRRRLDTSFAAEEIGFLGDTNLDRGLRKTVDWYTQYKNNSLA